MATSLSETGLGIEPNTIFGYRKTVLCFEDTTLRQEKTCQYNYIMEKWKREIKN